MIFIATYGPYESVSDLLPSPVFVFSPGGKLKYLFELWTSRVPRVRNSRTEMNRCVGISREPVGGFVAHQVQFPRSPVVCLTNSALSEAEATKGK